MPFFLIFIDLTVFCLHLVKSQQVFVAVPIEKYRVAECFGHFLLPVAYFEDRKSVHLSQLLNHLQTVLLGPLPLHDLQNQTLLESQLHWDFLVLGLAFSDFLDLLFQTGERRGSTWKESWGKGGEDVEIRDELLLAELQIHNNKVWQLFILLRTETFPRFGNQSFLCLLPIVCYLASQRLSGPVKQFG